MFLPPAVLVPTGRHPKVVALARAVSDEAEDYVRDIMDPMFIDLRGYVISRGGGDRITEHVLTRVTELRDLVRALPGTLAEQVSQAEHPDEVDFSMDPIINRKITGMSNDMPWLAPGLVHIRHALSRQSIENNIGLPAARKVGLTS